MLDPHYSQLYCMMTIYYWYGLRDVVLVWSVSGAYFSILLLCGVCITVRKTMDYISIAATFFGVLVLSLTWDNFCFLFIHTYAVVIMSVWMLLRTLGSCWHWFWCWSLARLRVRNQWNIYFISIHTLISDNRIAFYILYLTVKYLFYLCSYFNHWPLNCIMLQFNSTNYTAWWPLSSPNVRHRDRHPRLTRAKTYPHLVFADPTASPDRDEN